MAIARLFPSSPRHVPLLLVAILLICSIIPSSIASSSTGVRYSTNEEVTTSESVNSRYGRSASSQSSDTSSSATTHTITDSAIYLDPSSLASWTGDCDTTDCGFDTPCAIDASQPIFSSLATDNGQDFDCTLVWMSASSLSTSLYVVPYGTFTGVFQNLNIFYAGVSATTIQIPSGGLDPGIVTSPPELTVTPPGASSIPTATTGADPTATPAKPASMGVPPNARKRQEESQKSFKYSSSSSSSSLAAKASSTVKPSSSSSSQLRWDGRSSSKLASRASKMTTLAPTAQSLDPPTISVQSPAHSVFFYLYDYAAQGNGNDVTGDVASFSYQSIAPHAFTLTVDGVTFAPGASAFQSYPFGIVTVLSTDPAQFQATIQMTNCLFSLPSQLSSSTASIIYNPTATSTIHLTNVVIQLADSSVTRTPATSPLFVTNSSLVTLTNLTSTVYSTICSDCSYLALLSSYVEVCSLLAVTKPSASSITLLTVSSTLNGFNFTSSSGYNDLVTIATGIESQTSVNQIAFQGSFVSGFRHQTPSAGFSVDSTTFSASPLFNLTNVDIASNFPSYFSNRSSLVFNSARLHSGSIFVTPDSQASFYGTVVFDAVTTFIAMNISIPSPSTVVQFGSLDMTSSSFSATTYPGIASQQSVISGPTDGSLGSIAVSTSTTYFPLWALPSVSISNVMINMTYLDQLNYKHKQITGKNGISCSTPTGATCITGLPSKIQVAYTPVANTTAVSAKLLIANVATPSGTSPSLPTALGAWSVGFNPVTGVNTYQSFYFFDPSTVLPPPPVYVPPICGVGTFTCNTTTGVVTSNVSVTIPTLVITPGITTVQITGNFTVEGTLVFQDSSATITVSGCANVSSVTITITTETTATTQSLITQAGENCKPLTSIPVHVMDRTKSCKKTSVSTASSTASTLTAFFSYDHSGCNTKWIILGAVLGGVIVLAVIVLVLVFTFSESARECARPYSKKRKGNGPPAI